MVQMISYHDNVFPVTEFWSIMAHMFVSEQGLMIGAKPLPEQKIMTGVGYSVL